VGKLTNLTTLGLGNQLTEIPDFIGELTNLEKLYLSDNQLTEIPESVGKLTNLTTLHLSFNQ
jgi:internalin A